jgi:hypothetical protein
MGEALGDNFRVVGDNKHDKEHNGEALEEDLHVVGDDKHNG